MVRESFAAKRTGIEYNGVFDFSILTLRPMLQPAVAYAATFSTGGAFFPQQRLYMTPEPRRQGALRVSRANYKTNGLGGVEQSVRHEVAADAWATPRRSCIRNSSR
jgi:hypothetical protein